MSDLIEKFKKQFSSDVFYLVKESSENELNEFFGRFLGHPDFSKHKSAFSRQKKNQTFSSIDRFSWVPADVPGVFFEDTVREELLAAIQRREVLKKFDREELKDPDYWLESFEMTELAKRSPLNLSRGERVFLWLLLQVVKNPRFLVIDRKPQCFSPEKERLFFQLLNDLKKWGCERTAVIIGFRLSSEKNEILSKIKEKNCKVILEPVYEIFNF